MHIKTVFLLGEHFKRNGQLLPPPKVNVQHFFVVLKESASGLNAAGRFDSRTNIDQIGDNYIRPLRRCDPADFKMYGIYCRYGDSFACVILKLFELHVIGGARKLFYLKTKEYTKFMYVALSIYRRSNDTLI